MIIFKSKPNRVFSLRLVVHALCLGQAELPSVDQLQIADLEQAMPKPTINAQDPFGFSL